MTLFLPHATVWTQLTIYCNWYGLSLPAFYVYDKNILFFIYINNVEIFVIFNLCVLLLEIKKSAKNRNKRNVFCFINEIKRSV